jgi:hypothetical protein
MTAPISPGSSGSPVLDQGGKVIGVATLMSLEERNLSFAIPVEEVSAALAFPTPQIGTSDKRLVLPDIQQTPQAPQRSSSTRRSDNQFGNELDWVYRQLSARLPARQRKWLRLGELRWIQKHEEVRGDQDTYIKMTQDRVKELKQILAHV